MENQVSASFSYAEMTTRNLGFVDAAEQARLRQGRVFVCGTGGMGGACILSLARAGVGALEIADIDHFEVSNLNRQVFATLDTVGREKAAVTREALLRINPELEIRVHGREWTEKLDEILSRCKIVVNGMDDVAAGIELYRKAREHGALVIDAYASPLPSVTAVRASDPRPEERLGYPTRGLGWRELTPELIDRCKFQELVYVLVNSSSRSAVHLDLAVEMFTGKRARMSFAPMVITTGNLMAFEAVKAILGKDRELAGCRGYFFNWAKGRIERPRHFLVAWILGIAVRKFLGRLLG